MKKTWHTNSKRRLHDGYIEDMPRIVLQFAVHMYKQAVISLPINYLHQMLSLYHFVINFSGFWLMGNPVTLFKIWLHSYLPSRGNALNQCKTFNSIGFGKAGALNTNLRTKRIWIGESRSSKSRQTNIRRAGP